jgi:hypothetical protein
MTSGASLTARAGKDGVMTALYQCQRSPSYNDNVTTVCLSWEHDGARYHVWIDRRSYTIEAAPTFKGRPTLYMNSPPNVLLRTLALKRVEAVGPALVKAARRVLSAAHAAQVRRRRTNVWR